MSQVISVNLLKDHRFSKKPVDTILLIEGKGVAGDAHCGKTVKHRSRVRKDPSVTNLRQVHLIAEELITELCEKGFNVFPGSLGENITTHNIDLLALPQDTLLTFEQGPVIQITGLRNPCSQLDDFQDGLMSAVLEKDSKGKLKRKAGVMAIVLKGGKISTGDAITCQLPPEPHKTLERV